MLALDDERWALLTTFYPEPKALPQLLRVWLDALGSDDEELIYQRDLFDLFLHQNTITNAAFAVVPWLGEACRQGRARCQTQYLMDIATVEANRLSHGVYGNRPGTDAYPAWLMADYEAAVIEARGPFDDAIAAERDQSLRQWLEALKPALYGDATHVWDA